MSKNTASKKTTNATKPKLQIAPAPEASAPHDEGVATVSMHVLGSAAKQVSALYLALGRIAAGPLTAESEQVRAFPEAIYAPWQPRAEAAANRIQELDPIDLVIAAGEPYVDFSVALRLNVDHGVPFVLDDRGALNDGGDSEERGGWLTDVPAEDQSPLDKRVLTWLEFALSTALSVWFVNPLVADRHRDHFPSSADRIRVVDDVGEALPTALQDAASALTS